MGVICPHDSAGSMRIMGMNLVQISLHSRMVCSRSNGSKSLMLILERLMPFNDSRAVHLSSWYFEDTGSPRRTLGIPGNKEA